MVNQKITYEDIITGRAMLGTESAQVDYVESEVLPKIHFQWTSSHIVDLTEAQVIVVKRLFPDAEIRRALVDYSTEEKQPYVRAVRLENGKPVRQHMHFCNFRRYGWSETPEKEGETGYANDVIYANRLDGGVPATSAEQVIRDTLIRMISISRVPKNIKYSVAVRSLWHRLLEDAIKNASVHAENCVMSTNGYCYGGKLVVDGRKVSRT